MTMPEGQRPSAHQAAQLRTGANAGRTDTIPVGVSKRKLPLPPDQSEYLPPGLFLPQPLRRIFRHCTHDRSSWHLKHLPVRICGRCDQSLFPPGPMGNLSRPTFHDVGLPLAPRIPETLSSTKSVARTADGCACEATLPQLVCRVC